MVKNVKIEVCVEAVVSSCVTVVVVAVVVVSVGARVVAVWHAVPINAAGQLHEHVVKLKEPPFRHVRIELHEVNVWQTVPTKFLRQLQVQEALLKTPPFKHAFIPQVQAEFPHIPGQYVCIALNEQKADVRTVPHSAGWLDAQNFSNCQLF